jgi:uncharacterized membrane protein
MAAIDRQQSTIMEYRWSYAVDGDRHQWICRRNCALSPAQLGLWFGSLALLSLMVSLFFAFQGAWMVMPFAALEIAALGLAFYWWSRHATDFERIVVDPGGLRVEASRGERVSRIERRSRWVRIEYSGGRREPIRLVTAESAIEVGGLVPDGLRAALAREIRGVLAGAGTGVSSRG